MEEFIGLDTGTLVARLDEALVKLDAATRPTEAAPFPPHHDHLIGAVGA